MSPEKEIANNLNSYPYGEKITEEYIDFCIENNLLIAIPSVNNTIQLVGMINKSYYDDETVLLGQKGDEIKLPISINGYDEFDSIIKVFTNTDCVSVPNTTKKTQNYITENISTQQLYSDLPYEKFFLTDERKNELGIVINLNNLKSWQ